MTALGDILKKLTAKSKTPRSAADLRADLGALNLTDLEQQVDALEAERRRLLLVGGDDDVAAVSGRLIAANLALERGHAAREELAKRIAEAEQREAEAALADAEAKARGLRDEIDAASNEAGEAADKLGELLRGISAAIDELRRCEFTIATARGDRVARTPDFFAIRDGVVRRITR